MRKKIVFISPEQVGGVHYHRVEIPLVHLMENTDHEYFVTNSVMELEFKPDLVIANRTVSLYGIDHNRQTIDYLKEHGIPYILDVDDFWYLNAEHPLNLNYEVTSMSLQIIETLQQAAQVWVTNEYLAEKVRRHNKSVVVIPNAIDFNQPQFDKKPKPVHRVNIGWAGSSTHVPDIQMLATSFRRLHKDKDIAMKYMVLHAGWHHEVKESLLFEDVFTAGGRANQLQYQRVPAVDVYNYARAYEPMHISLCPLADNEFNKCKSFLKALESGAKGCAVIASNIHPYNDLLRHEDNALLVDPKNNEKGWHNAIKRLVNDPALRQRLADKLYEDVRTNYDIKSINQIRINQINSI